MGVSSVPKAWHSKHSMASKHPIPTLASTLLYLVTLVFGDITTTVLPEV